jgi:hypothetical protein
MLAARCRGSFQQTLYAVGSRYRVFPVQYWWTSGRRHFAQPSVDVWEAEHGLGLHMQDVLIYTRIERYLPFYYVRLGSLLDDKMIFSFNARTGGGNHTFHAGRQIPGTILPPDPAIHSTRDAGYQR